NQLSDMEDTVRGARNSDDLESLDRDQVERLAGPSARQSLDELRRMTQLLEEAGLIRKDGERYELTPRGIRKIGQRSLEEIFATRKVTPALDSLIRSTFPKDDLYIVGFSAYATQLKPTDLPRLTWNEYVYGTNMQHAFETARTLLARSRGKNKQIILITDGEPTAYFEPGASYPQFNYPPTKRT